MIEPRNLAIALAALNLFAFALLGFDKALARLAKRRVPEKWLLAAAAALAAPGALIGMVLFNHKTSKPAFRYGAPAFLVAQAFFVYWLAFR